MKHFRLLVMLSLLVFVAAYCAQPEPEKQTVSVSPNSLTFTEEGGSNTISVTANGTWYAEVQGSWMTLSASAGSGNGSVTVTAPANTGDARTGTVVFKSADATASVSVSQDAHVEKVLSLKEVRALYKGVDYKFSDEIFTEGTVISDYRRNTDGGLNNYSSAKTVIISDGEAGLMLYCSAENKDFARGDKVKVNLKGQTLSVYNNGPVQVNGLPLANIAKTGTGSVTAREVTMEELLTGNYESTYVAVKDVQVEDDYVGKTFVIDGKNTSIPFQDKEGSNFDLFTSQYATFGSETVPSGSGTLKGIAGKYGARIQLTVSEKGDYAGLTGARFSSGARFLLSFNEYPVWGDAGSFYVTVTSDVPWTATSSDSDFTLDPASGTGDATVTIRYTDNPSSTATRTAELSFKPGSSTLKAQTLTVVQQPYELLSPSPVQSWLELPAMTSDDKHAFFSHDMSYGGSTVRNYSFWLDLENKVSLWVAYPLYKGLTSGVTRTDKWAFDPIVPRRFQGDASRSYSGYDRGHQLPSADRLCNTEANETTFYYTNLTPQNADLNQGLWEELEKKVRDQISGADTLYVVTGCLLGDASTAKYVKDAQGRNVAVPTHYYKVILKYKAGGANGGYSAIGFVMENKAYGATTLSKSFACSVDEVEKLTGLDFFVNLKKDYETEAESKFDAASWGL